MRYVSELCSNVPERPIKLEDGTETWCLVRREAATRVIFSCSNAGCSFRTISTVVPLDVGKRAPTPNASSDDRLWQISFVRPEHTCASGRAWVPAIANATAVSNNKEGSSSDHSHRRSRSAEEMNYRSPRTGRCGGLPEPPLGYHLASQVSSLFSTYGFD